MVDENAIRVAIVDDEESIRRALLRLFRLTDFRAEAFASAAAFLDSLSEGTPDCLILDLQMPGMTGVELLEQVAAMSDPPPVIVVTADDARHTQDECMALGTKHYFRKPIDCKTLIESVREVVRRPT